MRLVDACREQRQRQAAAAAAAAVHLDAAVDAQTHVRACAEPAGLRSRAWHGSTGASWCARMCVSVCKGTVACLA
eukprot:1159545-Pelagomonas_calceolata.AAC.7